MAETNRSGSTTAIVGVVAILALLAIVWLVFLRGGADTGGGTDVDVNVDPGGAIEDVAE